MSFAWPLALVALALVPALLAAYLWSLRRRRRYAVRHPDLALLRAALPPRARWRPHLPVSYTHLDVYKRQTPEMALWNSHPRVYLPIQDEPGHQSQCPYCGAIYQLID